MKVRLFIGCFSFHGRAAFTLIEMVLTIGVLSILGGMGIYTYANSYRVNLLNNTAEEIVSLARFAQQESISQKEGSAWGIRVDHLDPADPFVAVFSGTYAPANVREYYRLPAQVSFESPLASSTVEIVFAKLSGLPSTSTSIVLALRSSSITKIIAINESGGISKN